MPVGPGDRLGHFLLLERIGQGGMGVVWKAEDTLLGRTVAIKILPDQSSRDERLRRMFLEEARLASSLSDAHIAQVHELGHQLDLDFIVMEYVEGSPLSRLVHGRPLPPARVAAIGAQVSEALARTHRKGLIHRDLKPANIIISPEGNAKVVDFGLATLFQRRETTAESEEPTLTGVVAESTILGTPSYMSPEQVRGEPLDGRTDIFSLGVVLYQMTTGKMPFRGDNNEDVLGQILKARPTPARDLVPRLPFELDRIIQKTMAARRADRYQTMEDLAVDLRRLGEELESGSAPSYADLKREARPAPARARRWPVWLTIAAIAALIAAGSWVATRRARVMAAERTILILPLDVRGQAEGAEYAGRAFAEALAVNLAQLKRLTVLPVPAVDIPHGADALAPAKAAREVGAGRVLGGALTREGTSVQASLSLVDANQNRILWGTQEKGLDDDLPRLASSLARQAATALGEEPPRLYEYFKNLSGSSGMAASADFTFALGAIRVYDTAGALEATRKLVEAFPSEADARVLRTYALALDAFEFGPSSPKRRILEEGIASIALADRNSPWDDVFRAILLSRDGHYHEAIRIFSEVLARDDLTPAARAYVLNGRSNAESELPDPGAAGADLREALRLDPVNDITLASLAHALMRQKRMDEALQRARQAVALNPSRPLNNQTLGNVLYQLERWEEAVAPLELACQQERSQTSCAYHAVTLFMARRGAEARVAAQRAASLPESDLGTYNLACYYALTGQRAEALRLLRRSLELGPGDPDEIAGDAALSSLRGDPGFEALMSEASRRYRR
jgi:tetratricopeptide (TPR) repeat protein/predicted Ser/Thr protein kinase